MQSPQHTSIEPVSRWERVALASGIAFVIAQLGALAYWSLAVARYMPPFDTPALQRVPFYLQHGASLIFANYLLTLPAPLFLVFLGGLYGMLRRVEGGTGAFALVTVAAGSAMAMTWPFGIILSHLGVGILQNGGDAATAWTLDAMAPYSLALSAMPRSVLLAATSVLLLHSRLTARSISWLGLILAPASLVGTAVLVVPPMFPVLALSTLLFELWVLALSVALLRSARPARLLAAQGLHA